MAKTTTNHAIPYAELTDANNLAYVSESMADKLEDLFNDVDEVQQQATNLPSGLYGTYTGQPLKVRGGVISITTNAAAYVEKMLNTDFTGGLLSVVFTGSPAHYQFRVIGGLGNNTVGIGVRDSNGTAMSNTTLTTAYIAIGW